ncbi:discoidin domain-containing protein [Pontiellaceae bacterium B12227]|nr:discoidin domain-containing protein [Pontiellaceae bacterium B12227]
MRKLLYRKATVTLAIASLCMGGARSAYAESWDGGGADNEFSTALNWNNDVIPTNNTADINGAYTVERSVDIVCTRTFVSGGATLNVTGGTHNDNLSGANKYNFIGSSSAGTVNQSGGSYSIGHGLRVGGNNASSDAEYNLTGGTLAVYRGSSSAIEPTNPGGRPSLEVGGTAGTGQFEITGGAFETRAGVHIGATGTFSVQGSAASSIGIGSNQDGDGLWLQKAGGTLKVGINIGGITKILIDEVDGDGGQQVTFEAGALLDVDYFGAGEGGGTWTVMELENGDITNNGLAFASSVDTNIWSFAIDNTGVNGLLTVTAEGDSVVREPGDVTWDGEVSSDWWNPLNWDSDDGLIAGDNAFIDFGPVDFSSGTSSNLNALKIRAGTLNISDGVFKATNHANRESWIGDTSGTTGMVNQTGGDTDINAMEIGRSSGSTGFYNLTAGDFKIGRGVSDFSLFLGSNRGGNAAGDGTFTVSGGSFITRTGVKLGDGTSAGTGTFEVFGSECTSIGVGLSGSGDGYWEQYAGSTLRVGIELGLTGVTKVYLEDYEDDGGTYATFEAGSLLDVGYYNGGYGGGTWTVMEVENGAITNNGLAFAPGVNAGVWSFNIDNSGANGKLTVTAAGDPAPPQIDVTLHVGDTRNQMMRYGVDYERLSYWKGSGLGPVPDWTVNDCNIDYIRTAVHSGYELTENVYDLDAYFGDVSGDSKDKIIPMMTAMQNANPHIKWFASPRPLNSTVSGASWQPYPIWITGAPIPSSEAFDFDDIKCAQYLIRYLRLMKHYGFKISYLDLTNEWQSNIAGGRITQADARDLVEYMKAYIADPSSYQADVDPTGFYATNYPELEDGDMPLIVAPSSWEFSQGESWISNLNTDAKKNAIDIASSHNTNRDEGSGTEQSFADQVHTTLGADTEIWQTEVHGWKHLHGANEVTSFDHMMRAIRAGFSGLNGWLALAESDGHTYLWWTSSKVTRGVKHFIFQKLSNTSNYGYSLDINEPAEFNNTMAFVSENVLTVWVNNMTNISTVAEIDIGNHAMAGSTINYTQWNESLAVEGVDGSFSALSSTNFAAAIEGESLYCFEIPLVDNEDNFPFVQAENYDSISGATDQSTYVTFNAGSSETSYDLDITKTYPHDVAFRVSSESADIAFDIYNGTTLLASVDRPATGGALNWTTIYKTLMLDGGPMELRIVAANGGWSLDWIAFDRQFYSTGSELDNIALDQTYDASNVYQGNTTYGADKAFDGNRTSRWATDSNPAWLEVEFQSPTTVNAFSMYEYQNRTTGFEIQYSDDGATWYTAYTGGNPEDDVVYGFPTVTARFFRYQSITSSGNPSIYELEFYHDPYFADWDPAVASMTLDGSSVSLEWSGVEGSTYALQSTTNLVDGFTTVESGIPVHEATNMNTIATPDDAAFYRVILE